MHKRLAISISVILLLITIACSKRPNDEQIQKDIQTKVAADPDTRDAAITVESKDGKVTLTGKVASPAAQQKLEQIAKDEPGATGVDDQTAVDPQAWHPSQWRASPWHPNRWHLSPLVLLSRHLSLNRSSSLLVRP